MLALMDQAEPFIASDAEATIAANAFAKLRAVAQTQQDIRIIVQDKSDIVVPLPARAVLIIVEILEKMASQTPISIIPHAAELTTQQAADYLNVSRPFLVGLLDKGLIDHRMVGAHRRIRYGDLLRYEAQSKKERRAAIEAMIAESQRLGLE